MRIHVRARRLALTLACLGAAGGVGGTVLLGGGSAAAAGTFTCASAITGSGSSLQKIAQEHVFTVDFASTLCVSKPAVKYTSSSSGPALEEFGDQGAEELKPASSNSEKTGTALNGYVSSDDPPTPAEVNKADVAAGGGSEQELTIPVAVAPVAVLIDLPEGCEVTAEPDIPNEVLNRLWQGQYKTWKEFLVAANVGDSGASCDEESMGPLRVRRLDNSGTSYVFKSYMAQIESSTWAGYANDFTDWPNQSTAYAASAKGGSGEAGTVAKGEVTEESGGTKKAVRSGGGLVGYAAASDAYEAGFRPWTSGAKFFWAEVQNNGKGTSGLVPADFSDPATPTGNNGNCPTDVAVKGAPTAPGEWSGVLESNPSISSEAGYAAGQYPVCGLTYSLSWRDYAQIGAGHAGQAAYFGGSATSGDEVGDAVADYLGYVVSTGQGNLASAGFHYSALPANVQKVAEETAAEINHPVQSGGGGGEEVVKTGGGTTTTTTTAAATTTSTSTSATTSALKPSVAGRVPATVKSGKLSIALACTGAECSGKVTVKTVAGGKGRKKVKAFTVGSKSYEIAGGGKKTVSLSVGSKAAALLKRNGSLKVRVTITVTGGKTVTTTVTLRAKK